MGHKTKSLAFHGQVTRRHEASPKLKQSGDAALVFRGVNRELAIKCPDGCGEELTINLDPRTGPAWLYFETDRGVSLYPSVWRESGCRSHFILWNGRIYWCDTYDPLASVDEDLLDRVLRALPTAFMPYSRIADAIAEVPWAVLSALNTLVRQGRAEGGAPRHKGQFRRVGP